MSADLRPSHQIAAEQRAFHIAWIIIAAYALVQSGVNAATVAHDHKLSLLEPLIWEYSSGLIVIALVPLIQMVTRRAAKLSWPGLILAHCLGATAFSLLHVGGFLTIRKSIYALAGDHYGSVDLLYEYRKDLTTWALLAGTLWTAGWIARLRGQTHAAPQDPLLYVLRDGRNTFRVAIADIVSVVSARNYVEFRLKDGARPLVRGTLAAVERELAAHGLLRTHRSWLVNASHVRAVRPAPGGDWRLELADGHMAPLSRRFPSALQALSGA